MFRLTCTRDGGLPAGTITVPVGAPGGCAAGAGVSLRLGCSEAVATVNGTSPAGALRLAPDLWERLAVPFHGIDLAVRAMGADSLELGPSVAVLNPGPLTRRSRRLAEDQAQFYFGHLTGTAGLFAIGFDEEIDWQRGTMDGFVLASRAGDGRARLLPAVFPIPAVVRLTWSIRSDVIEELRRRTGNRTFNWVRSIGKWEQHKLLSAVPELAEYLPETRLFRTDIDLMAMVAAHRTVFVKHVHGIQGRRSARVSLQEDGLEIRHMDGGEAVRRVLPPEAAPEYVCSVVGQGRSVVQQGLDLSGAGGKALDFRVVTVRTPEGGWRAVLTTANVAPDDRVVFTNIANGATDEDAAESLRQHRGMSSAEAERCLGRMADLCLTGSRALAAAFDPLGILGWDVAVEAGTHRLWLLEANAVPGWGYAQPVDLALARSQIDYALSLSGFSA